MFHYSCNCDVFSLLVLLCVLIFCSWSDHTNLEGATKAEMIAKKKQETFGISWFRALALMPVYNLLML